MVMAMANDNLGQIIGGVFNAGANIFDARASNKTSRRNVDKTIAAQKAEAELAYQRSIEQRDFMNQYNSPQAQMQRFIDAGLNPHLIYGQGSSGNQSSPISYQAPDLQYRYAAPKYGEAIGSFLPTLMAVGSWMQDMRATEAGIRKTEAETTRTGTVVDQMLKMNPELLRKIQGQIDLLPGQKAMQDVQRDRGIQALKELETEFRLKYGDDLFRQLGSVFVDEKTRGEYVPAKIGGMKGLEFLLEKQKLLQAESTTKLKEAQASWADFDITNPQQIMMLVLNGVLSMAGGAMKLRAGKAKPSSTQYRAKERPRGVKKRLMGPNHPDR